MLEYKSQSTIKIYTIEAIELNIPTSQFGLLDTDEEYLHYIEGTFMYCDLLVDGKLFVTESQFDELLTIENITIHKIVDSIIYINSFSSKARAKFNSLNRVVKVFNIDNIGDNDEEDDDEEVYYFQLI